MTAVLTALGNRWDSRVATLLEGSREVAIARRCVDLPDLVATAAAGLGTVALVSSDLRGLDLTSVAQLQGSGVRVVGIAAHGDEEAERRLRQLGITRVVPGNAELAEFEAALSDGDTASVGGVSGLEGLQELEELDRELETRAGLDVRMPAAPGPPVADAGAIDVTAGSPTRGASTHVVSDDGLDGLADRPPGRIVAVWGPTGAPGRTTVAVTLATELAGLGVPTVLVDADTYGGSVAQVLSFLDEAPGIAAATRAADQGSLDVGMLARLAPTATSGLRVLTGIPKADRWTEIRPAALERVLTVCRSLGQVVVVDCGFNLEQDEELSYDTQAPRRNAATLTSLGVADEVVVVGACDPVGLQRLVRGLQELGTVRSGRPTVVVNRVRAGAVGPRPEVRVAEALGRFAGVDDVVFVPEDRAGLDAALLEGRALAECVPQSPVRAAVRVLAARVAPVPQSRTGRRRFGRRGALSR